LQNVGNHLVVGRSRGGGTCATGWLRRTRKMLED